MKPPLLLKQAERRAARQRLAREGIICGPKAPNTFLASCVARALSLPMPREVEDRVMMVRAYAAPALPKGDLVEGRKFEFRVWVPDALYLEAVRKSRAWQRGPAVFVVQPKE